MERINTTIPSARRMLILVWAIVFVAMGAPGVSRGAVYPEGFVWDRELDFTDGTIQGNVAGNPDDDSGGEPVWEYDSVSGDGLGGPAPWYLQPATLMTWDAAWFGGIGVWSRANDVSPLATPTTILHLTTGAFWNFIPRVRWKNPTGCGVTVRVSGDLTVAWSGTGGIGQPVDVDIVLAISDISEGVMQEVLASTVSKPNPVPS